jgi:hypothetical protein
VTAIVRFVGTDEVLSGLEITVPVELQSMAPLRAALRKMRIQAMQVQLCNKADCAHYLLDVAELDGSDVSRERWAALQGVVLTCIIEASMSVLGQPQTKRSSWRAFRDMLQKAPPRVFDAERRQA